MQLNRFSISPKKCILVFVQLEQSGYVLKAGKVNSHKVLEDTNLKTFDTVESLVKTMGKHNPYLIHVNGFGVLTRIVENVPNFKEGLLVSGNESEFYFNDYATKGKIGVSFVRKSLINDITVQLELQNVFLLGVFIGPIPLLPKQQENFNFKGEYLIQLRNGELTQLERNTELNSELLQDKILRSLPEVSFLSELDGYHQGLDEGTIAQTKSQFREYLRFVYLGLFILSFFLVTLISNYFYVNHLNQEAAELEAQISTYGSNFSLIDRLRQEKTRKLMLIENSGIQSKHYISYYLDQIGKSVPQTISLTLLETFPLKEPLKPKKKMELNSELISVIGLCNNSKVLDDWMEVLEQKEWIRSVELINYIQTNNQEANFELEITLHQ